MVTKKPAELPSAPSRTRSKPWVKRVVLMTVVGAMVFGLIFSLRAKPIPVEVREIKRGTFVRTIREDGVTRVRERYVVSAPLLNAIFWPNSPLHDSNFEVIGVLDIQSDRIDGISEKDQHILLAFAGRVSAVIDNLLLTEELRRYVNSLEEIVDQLIEGDRDDQEQQQEKCLVDRPFRQDHDAAPTAVRCTPPADAAALPTGAVDCRSVSRKAVVKTVPSGTLQVCLSATPRAVGRVPGRGIRPATLPVVVPHERAPLAIARPVAAGHVLAGR